MALGWKGQYTRYKEFFLNIAALYKQRADLRAFLEVILSLSTVIIFLLFALKPTVLTIISLLQEIKSKQITVVALTQKVKDLQTASKIFTQNQDFIKDIDKAVATSPEPDIIMQQIEGISSKNSVSILGVSIGKITLTGVIPIKKGTGDLKPLPEGANAMSISISVKGDYLNLVSFIKDLENLRIIIKIDNLEINSSTTDKGQVIVAVISGRLPYLGK